MIRVHQRNDRLIPYQIKDETDTPVQIVDGVDVLFVVTSQTTRDAPIISKRLSEGITVINAAEGKLEIALTPEDTSKAIGTYLFELLLIDVDNHRYTADKGYFVVVESITKGVD